MPQAPAQSQQAAGQPQALDPDVVNLAKAIRGVETKNVADPFTAKGSSGEYGAYQNTAATWSARAAAAGLKNVGLTDATPEQQNQVFYTWAKSMKDKGFNVGQIASMQNAGEGEPNAYTGKFSNGQTSTGVNKFGVKYDVPAYSKAVAEAYQSLKANPDNPTLPNSPSTIGAEQRVSPSEMADMESAQKYGAFFPASASDSPFMAGAKTLGNLPGSAFNFAKGAIQTMNPINTVNTVSQIPGAFNALAQESGGTLPAIEATLKEMPGTAYQMLVPEAVRSLISAGHGAITGNQSEVDQGLQTAQRSIENDPFGQIAPLVFAGKGAAKALDATGITSGADAAFEKGMSAPTDAATAVAKTAMKPVVGAFGAAKNAAEFAGRQLTGINAETARTLEQNPDLKMGDVTRETLGSDIENAIAAKNPGITPYSLGQELQGAIDSKTNALDEAGASYSDIRQSETPLKLDKASLASAIQETTGLAIKKGQFAPTPKSFIDQPADVARVQRFYDTWQPYFDKGQMTADDFLTMRSKLAKLAYNDAGLKSGDMSNVAGRTRGILNTVYRDQVPGLAEKDAEFASLSSDLKTFKKGLFDKDGQLTDTGLAKIQKASAEKPQLLSQLESISPGIGAKVQAFQAFRALGKGLVDDNGKITDAGMRRIANAANESNPLMLQRLEQLKPGITDAITKYKALQDVEKAANKMAVGTYARPIGILGLGYGAFSMNIPVMVAAVSEMILAEPENAMKIIQTYGKSKALVSGVVQRIGAQAKAALNAVNNIPSHPLVQTGAFGSNAARLPVGQ